MELAYYLAQDLDYIFAESFYRSESSDRKGTNSCRFKEDFGKSL